MDYKKILSLPKTELHCHLDGSLSLGCIRDLLGRDVSLEELSVSDDCKDLKQYLEKFKLPLQAIQTREGLIKGAKDFLENVAKENVQYVEVRFSPVLCSNDALNERDVLEAVLDGLKQGKELYGVESNIILSLIRGHSESINERMVKLAKDYLNYGLCAIDLAGNEAAYPMKNFLGTFSFAKDLGIPFTVHAGECGSVQNVEDSIDIGARRIGHGISLRNSLEILDYAKSKHIGIEMCPISNLQTKSVKTIEDYPIKHFLKNHLLVTINTDNRTVSNTSLSKEFKFIQDKFNVTDEELYTILMNSVEVSFASDQVKERCIQKIYSCI